MPVLGHLTRRRRDVVFYFRAVYQNRTVALHAYHTPYHRPSHRPLNRSRRDSRFESDPSGPSTFKCYVSFPYTFVPFYIWPTVFTQFVFSFPKRSPPPSPEPWFPKYVHTYNAYGYTCAHTDGCLFFRQS